MDIRRSYQLPKKLERLLASLAVKYRKDGEELLLRIIANSQYYVKEGYTYDNWNGGQSGHAVYFQVPENLYHEIMDNLGYFTQEINQGLNRLCNIQDEFIAEVFIELAESAEVTGWRERSGALLDKNPALVPASTTDQERLWTPNFLRVFLSHKSEFKVTTKKIKGELKKFGISCFVAHEDIEPTKEWQDEIERALASMQIMVPLMTEKFNESNWTDQEVGVGIGRGIPIVAVRLGKDPYGFIGKYQGLPGADKNEAELAKELFKLFLKHDEIRSLATDAWVVAIENIQDYDHGNSLAEFLPMINELTSDQVIRIVRAYNDSGSALMSYGLNGNKPYYYGSGLPHHLTRITGQKYEFRRGEIVLSDT